MPIYNIQLVEVVSGVRAGEAKAFGKRISVTAVEPNVTSVIDLKWKEGSVETPAQLGRNGALTGVACSTLMNAPSRVRNRNFASTKAPSNA